MAGGLGGNGIALALTLASFVNTVFLFIFMKKLNSIKVKKVVKDTVLYIVKISIFSVIAAIPCYFLRPLLVNFFEPYGRVIGYGAPIFILAVVFAVIGVAELVITKDEIVRVVMGKVRRSK